MNENKPLLYLAGKVTGIEYNECFAKFEAKEKELQAKGYEVINPMRIVPEGTDWDEAMTICINKLEAESKNLFGAYFMPCSANSKGAMIEKKRCQYYGIRIIYAIENLPFFCTCKNKDIDKGGNCKCENICTKCKGKGWYYVDEFIGTLQGRRDCECKKI